MIAFSDSHVENMRAERMKLFAVNLAERARFRHPEATKKLEDDALIAGLSREIAMAKRYGLKTKSELERFSDLSMTLGFGFSESEDWAQSLFLNKKMKPRERLTDVENTAVFVIRERQ